MSHTPEQLQELVNEFKALTLTMSAAAGAGHVGGALSGAESLITVWFEKFNVDTNDENRDRFFLGPMHFTPGIYSLLVKKGHYDWKETVGYRRIGSPFEGHPNISKIKGWELSGGSLGQALGVAVGSAIAAKIRGKKYWIVTHNSDGELQEGSMWEAIMYAGTHGLDNLITFFDINRIQSYNRIEECSEVEPVVDKLKSFNWNVIEVNGNNIEEVAAAYDKSMALKNGKPTAIVGHTIIGNGVSFLEDKVSSHNMAPAREQIPEALAEIGTSFPHEEFFKLADEHQVTMARELAAGLPDFGQDYGWNSGNDMQVEEVWTGLGISEGFRKCMDSDPNVIAVTQDSYKLIGLTDDDRKKYGKTNQFFDVGVAEQNMSMVSAGLAKEGLTPITNGYATFALGRAYDQIRVSVSHPRNNVKYFPTEGLLGGDGPFHECLESVALGYYLPHMQVQWPCDNIEAHKATLAAIRDVDGPVITLQERAPKPVVTSNETPYQYGIANIIRYTGRQPNFVDAFETYLSTNWQESDSDVVIVACGSQVSEALRAAVILKETRSIQTTVVNLHTLKPIDKQGLLKAVKGCRGIITVAQQQKTILGNIVAGVILDAGAKKTPNLDKLVMMGIDDGYGDTGKHHELVQQYGLTGEHIAEKAQGLMDY
ncbi:MAG: transketolase C-terminal domain-containing protein [Pseudomonadota bacterium]|nr:transketolase C-terminal domain-containing protein [Pseudomonadota bacterium]